MQTLRATRHHFREGSTGGEFISAVLKLVLSVTWLTGNANSSSSLFQILHRVPGGIWLLLVIGAIHLTAWTQPDYRPWLTIRKACSSVGVGVWCSLLYDLVLIGATATIILVAPMLVLMAYAVGRKRYEMA